MRWRLVHHEEQEHTMNRYLVSFLILALSGVFTTAQAAELGRLFFTPQQREQLDFQQRNGKTPEKARHNYIIVNGVVQKKGGDRTVWINGTAQPPERGHDRNPTVETVTVPGKSHPVQLKVGEPLLLQAPAPAPEENN
jgi:hypothetical protein